MIRYILNQSIKRRLKFEFTFRLTNNRFVQYRNENKYDQKQCEYFDTKYNKFDFKKKTYMLSKYAISIKHLKNDFIFQSFR